MINDRHADPEPYIFSTAEAAITYARETAQDYASRPGDFKEQDTPDGWLYYATYSSEGDSVWVLAKELEPTEEEVPGVTAHDA
jgi:hypothetical protein